MTEWEMQAVLSDHAYANMRYPELVRDRMRAALAAKGVTSVRFEEERLIEGPTHDNIEYSGCPYAVFATTRPGADLDEYPICAQETHWLSGFRGWVINVWGDA